VKENVCIMLSYKGIIKDSELVWIPLYPKLTTPTYLVWKKYQVFTQIVELFLKQLIGSFEAKNKYNLPV